MTIGCSRQQAAGEYIEMENRYVDSKSNECD